MKKVKENKKTNKKQKKNSKNHLPLIIGIVLSLVTGIAVPLVMDQINSQINPPVEEEYVPLDPEFLAKPTDGTTPKDYTAIDNYRFAGGVLSLTDNFKTEQEGIALSEGLISNKQIVNATRYVNSKRAYVQYSTSSSFVESAVERMYLEDKVIVRNGKFVNDIPSYDDEFDPYVYSYEYILDNIGWLPFSMTSYIINEDNIVSSKIINDSEYPYSMELILDNTNSIAHTKREVRYNANAVTYPKYEQVKVTISMDNDWRVLEIKTEDIYDITVKMGINMTVGVESTLTEKFYYENCDLESLQSYTYFNQFIDEEVNDDEENVKEKTAIDYVFNVIFDVILNGTTFDVKAKVQEQELNGIINVKMDITSLSANIVGLFDEFYFKYDGDLYISYLKHSYKFDASFIEHLINSLGSIEIKQSNERSLRRQEQEDAIMDSLGSLVDNLILEKDGRNVKISMPLESEDMSLSLELNFFEMDQGTVLKSIKVVGEDVDIALSPTSKKIEFEESEYNDLSSATWLIDEMVEISSYNGVTLHTDYILDSYTLDLDINISSDNKILTEFYITNVEGEEVRIELYYIDEMFYLEFDNYMIEASQDDIELLIGYIASIIEEFTQEETPEVIELSEDEEIVEEETPEEIDVLGIVYDLIGTISMKDDDHFNVPIILSSLDENLSDTNIIISVNENGNLNFNLEDLNLDLEVKEYGKEIVLPTSKPTYTKDIIDVIQTHYSNIEEKVSGDSFRVLFDDVTLTLEEGELVINGEYRKYQDSYSIELEFSKLFNMKFRVIYLVNKYYISMGENSYTINIVLNEKQIETFIDYMDEIFDYILGENDFDASLEKFITDIVDRIMAILNGEVDMTIGDLLFTSLDIIDSSIVKIDENNVIVEIDQTKVQLYKISDNYFLLIEGLEFENYKIEGDVTLKQGGSSISVNSSDYFDISEIFENLEIPNIQM